MDWICNYESGKDWIGKDGIGKARIGNDWIGQDWIEQDSILKDWIGNAMDWKGLVRKRFNFKDVV